MSRHLALPRLIEQHEGETISDGLGDGDRFFSDVENDLSAGSNPLTMASGPEEAAQGDAWFSEPTSPDLTRYWKGAEAAWYPDPTHPDLIRYWDGSRWTDLVTREAPGDSPWPPRYVEGEQNRRRRPGIGQDGTRERAPRRLPDLH